MKIVFKRTEVPNYLLIRLKLSLISDFHLIAITRYAPLYNSSRVYLYVLFLDYQRRFKFA
jgi:hypothetical protein